MSYLQDIRVRATQNVMWVNEGALLDCGDLHEGIQIWNAGSFNIFHVAGDQSQIMFCCGSRYQPVDHGNGVRHVVMGPSIDDFFRHRQDVVTHKMLQLIEYKNIVAVYLIIPALHVRIGVVTFLDFRNDIRID